MVKIQTEVDGYRMEGGEGIRRNWMSRAIISISVIRVQTVFQTGAWFCYKCSRQVSGSAFDSILVLSLAFQVRLFAWILLQNTEFNLNWFLDVKSCCELHKHLGRFGSLSFNVKGRGFLLNSDRKRGRGGVQKLDIFHGCHKCMVPKLGCNFDDVSRIGCSRPS